MPRDAEHHGLMFAHQMRKRSLIALRGTFEHSHRLIQTLPDRPRMVVILRYQEEMEPTEIAQMMDIPIGTVKSMLHRALALLRGKMEREQKGAGK